MARLGLKLCHLFDFEIDFLHCHTGVSGQAPFMSRVQAAYSTCLGVLCRWLSQLFRWSQWKNIVAPVAPGTLHSPWTTAESYPCWLKPNVSCAFLNLNGCNEPGHSQHTAAGMLIYYSIRHIDATMVLGVIGADPSSS